MEPTGEGSPQPSPQPLPVAVTSPPRRSRGPLIPLVVLAVLAVCACAGMVALVPVTRGVGGWWQGVMGSGARRAVEPPFVFWPRGARQAVITTTDTNGRPMVVVIDLATGRQRVVPDAVTAGSDDASGTVLLMIAVSRDDTRPPSTILMQHSATDRREAGLLTLRLDDADAKPSAATTFSVGPRRGAMGYEVIGLVDANMGAAPYQSRS